MQKDSFNPISVLESIQFETLKKHPNILIAAAFWDKDRFEAARVCYRFMRKIDDMIDDRKAELVSLADCEKSLFTNKVYDWIECLQGKSVSDPIVAEVVDVIAKYNIPLSLFNNFARSMVYDIHNDGFPDFQSFLDYAEGASVAPASVFLHLCCLNEGNNDYVKPSMDLLDLARPCAIFSYLVHIIRDFEIDQQNNLNYFAHDLLKANDLSSQDLKKMANGTPISASFKNLIKTYCLYAEKYMHMTEKAIKNLQPFLPYQYLLSLQIIYRLYLEVFNRIENNNGTFRTDELTPTLEETKRIVEKLINESKKY
jgi:phytoene synthase